MQCKVDSNKSRKSNCVTRIEKEQFKLQKHSIAKASGRKKVLILPDSHSRGCSRVLRDNLGADYDVCAIVKPCALFDGAIDNDNILAKDFNTNDFIIVIIMGGTNDVYREQPFQYTIHRTLHKVLSLSKMTNLIFTEIPFGADFKSNVELLIL